MLKTPKKFSLYIRLHNILIKNCEPDMTIDFIEKKFKIINMKIPKEQIYVIIRELEEMKLGEKVGKTTFKINPNKCKMPRVIDYEKN